MEAEYIRLRNKMQNAYWNMESENFVKFAGKIMDEAEKTLVEHEFYALLDVYENLVCALETEY